MHLSFVTCLLISLVAFVVATERYSESFYISRPLIVSTLTGLVCGDLKTGIMAGGLVELAFIGIVPVGGTAIPDAISVAIMTVVIALTQNITITAAFGLAFTVGYLMQYLLILQRMAYSLFVKKTDQLARNCEIGKMTAYQIMGYVIIGLMFAVVIFVVTYWGQGVIGTLVKKFPVELTHGLSVAGGLLPAVGFGILLSIIYKPQYLPYLILGFVITSFLKFNNILPTAMIGAAFALLHYYSMNKKAETDSSEMSLSGDSSANPGDGGDNDDGI